MTQLTRTSRAFSLVELVIVLVILGVISAIAIPRLTRGANNAGSSALKSDLAVLRNAIELYRAEHEGRLPTAANFSSQMLQYSNAAGDTFAATPNTATGVIYGPYIRALPELPVGAQKGENAVGDAAALTAGADGYGWLYSSTTGDIIANTTDSEVDQDSVKYNTF